MHTFLCIVRKILTYDVFESLNRLSNLSIPRCLYHYNFYQQVMIYFLFIISIPDDDFDDGISRDTFVMAIRHVVKRRFGWKDAIADIIINEYTNWKKPDEHITNRNEYVQVSIIYRFRVMSQIKAIFRIHIRS